MKGVVETNLDVNHETGRAQATIVDPELDAVITVAWSRGMDAEGKERLSAVVDNLSAILNSMVEATKEAGQ